MAGQVFHLWRGYPDRPYYRYAASIVPDSTRPDGYRVTDHDPAVADVGFLQRLSDTLTQGVMVQGSIPGENGAVILTQRWVHPGEDGHFETAVRMVPGAYLRNIGRSA